MIKQALFQATARSYTQIVSGEAVMRDVLAWLK